MIDCTAPVPGVRQLTLSRPALRNALCCELMEGLRAALHAATFDGNVRVVMLAAAGECFCAGGDRSELQRIAAGDDALNQRQAETLAGLMLDAFEFPKPLLVVVNGPAIGAGMGLVVASDIAIASPAARFAMPEARLGLVSTVVAPYLVHALGERATRRWLLSGENMTAGQALALGLIHECVPAAELLPRSLALAADIMAGDADTLVATKRVLRESSGKVPDRAFALESAAALVRLRKQRHARLDG